MGHCCFGWCVAEELHLIDANEETSMIGLWSLQVGQCAGAGDALDNLRTSEHMVNASIVSTDIC